MKDLPHKRVLNLAWPMILSGISVPLLGVVDTAVLGHLDSAQYLGAVAVGSAVMSFLLWGFGFLRMGTTSLAARALGAQKTDELHLLAVQSLILAALIGCLLILSQTLYLPWAVHFISADDSIEALAHSYTQIRLLSAPAALINFAVIGWFIGIQDTRTPLLLMVSTNLINIVLDIVLVVVLKLNSDGAAIASACADYSGMFIGLYCMQRKLRPAKASLNYQEIIQVKAYKNLLVINRHLFIRTLILLASFAFFTSQGARQGETILAANAILLQLVLLTAYALDGFAHATEALIGKAVGAGDRRDFNRVLITSGLWSVMTAVLFTLFFWFSQHLLIGLFTDLEQVVRQVNHFYLWACAMPLVAVWSYFLDGVFIGTGRSADMLSTMAISCFLVFLPTWWISQSWHNHGLWLAFMAFNAARGIGLATVLIRRHQLNIWP